MGTSYLGRYRYMVLKIVGILAICLPIFAEASPGAFMYQGRILGSNGQPLEYSAVSFEFTILSPDGSCVLYKEQVSGVDMRNSKGVFETAIGSGVKSYPAAPSFSLLDAFSNVNGNLTCSGGVTYTPLASDGRVLRVQFYDGNGWKLITPDSVIRSVPYAGFATSAQRLGTKTAADFVSKPATCVAGEVITFDGTNFTCAAGGGGGSGTVTSVATGTGLTGGPITGTGTISLAPIADKNILANISGAAAAPSATTLSALIDGAISNTQGSVLYRNNSTWVALPPGTSGHFLQTQGAAANPQWAAPPAGSSGTVTSVAAGTGLTGGTITTTGTLAVNVGTGANQIPQLDGSGKLNTNVIPNSVVTTATTLGGDLSGNLPNPNVVGIRGRAIDSTAPTNGQVLIWDNGGNTWRAQHVRMEDVRNAWGGTQMIPSSTCAANQAMVWSVLTDRFTCQTIDDTLKLPLAGGTMTGDLNMGTHKITNVSNVPWTAANPAVGQDGQSLRWNNTAGQWEWFTAGAAGSGITSVNGQSGSAQTLAPTASSTSYGFTTGTNTHTFSIPSASGVGVTAGTISKTEYDTFNAKQAAGNYITTLTGDVTSSGFAAGSVTATIANNAVTTAKIADGNVTGAKLENSGVTAGTYTKVTVDAKGRVTVGDTLVAADIPNLDAAKITTGVLAPARLGTGTADNTTYLRGDGTWQTLSVTESDPQVGANTTNYLSKWDGSALVASGVFENAGSVGIGTTSPGKKLDVRGTMTVIDGSNASMSFDYSNTYAPLDVTTWATPAAHLWTESSATNTVQPALNLGIKGSGGTSAAGLGTGIRFVGDTNAGTGNMRPLADISAIFTGTVSDADHSAALTFSTVLNGSGAAATTERMRITAAGNVGIGTTSPSDLLSIQKNTNAENGIRVTNTSTGASAASTLTMVNSSSIGQFGIGSTGHTWASNLARNRAYIYADAAASGIVLVNADLEPIIFATNAVERMRVHSNGDVGIGTASPGAKLEVAGQVKITGGTPGAGKVLTSDATGLATWETPSSSGSVTSIVAGTGLTGGTITTTGTIAVDVGTGANQIPRLNGSGKLDANVIPTDLVTTSTTLGGDLSGTLPNPTVAKIQTRAVASTAPADGQVLLWDNGNTTWTPQYVRMQDIRNAWGGTQMIPSSACAANQSMTWSVVTDRFTCQNIGSLNASTITAGTIATARLGSGTADNTTYLRGDGTWATVSASQIGTNTTNYLSKWNGSQLVTSTVLDNAGDISLGNASVADTADGRSFTIHRMAPEGNASIQMYTDSYLDHRLIMSHNMFMDTDNGYPGTHALFFQFISGGESKFGGNVNIGSDWTANVNPTFRLFGNIDTDGLNYVQHQVNDSTNNYEITRQDSSIGYMDVQIPLMVTEKVEIHGDGDSALALLQSYKGDTSHSKIHLRGARGTKASPANINANDIIGELRYDGWRSGTNWGNAGNIQVVAPTTHTSGSTPGRMEFYTTNTGSTSSSTPAMVILPDGKIGMGQSTPSYKLHVQSTSNSTASTDLATSFNYMYAYPSSSSASTFIGQYNGVENDSGTGATVTGGLVGQSNYAHHNNSSTLTKLSGSWAGVRNKSTGTVTTAVGFQGEIENQTTGTITSAMGVHSTVIRTAGTITNAYGVYTGSVQGTNKWSIYASDATAPSYFAGNVGIGTTSPSAPLDVVTTATSGNIATFTSSGAGGAGCSIAWNGASCSSDARLKENVENVDGKTALADLLSLRPVHFTWIRDVHHAKQTGFIAQELEKKFREFVVTDANGYKQVNYAHFVSVLTAGLKELHKQWSDESKIVRRELASVKVENSALKKDNETLAKDNAELKARIEKQEQEILKIKEKLGL